MTDTEVFYAVTDCRADLIRLQALSLRTFCLDPYRFVVLDNTTPDAAALSTEIRREATACGATYVKVPFTVQNRNTANEAHASALCWAWREIIVPANPNHAILFDFDMFLLKSFSVNGWMRGAAVGGWPQGRPPIRYYWPGLLILDLWALPQPETIDLDCGRVHDVPVDVGGQFHHYLARHAPVVRDLTSCARIETPEAMRKLPPESLATYDPAFRVDVFHDAFVHHVAASGWDHPTEDLRRRKAAWITALVEKCCSGEWRMP